MIYGILLGIIATIPALTFALILAYHIKKLQDSYLTLQSQHQELIDRFEYALSESDESFSKLTRRIETNEADIKNLKTDVKDLMEGNQRWKR